MPLTSKGSKIMEAMKDKYGARGEEVFYRSKNAGTISGVDGAMAKDCDSARAIRGIPGAPKLGIARQTQVK